jgi:hypothetical protein
VLAPAAANAGERIITPHPAKTTPVPTRVVDPAPAPVPSTTQAPAPTPAPPAQPHAPSRSTSGEPAGGSPDGTVAPSAPSEPNDDNPLHKVKLPDGTEKWVLKPDVVVDVGPDSPFDIVRLPDGSQDWVPKATVPAPPEDGYSDSFAAKALGFVAGLLLSGPDTSTPSTAGDGSATPTPAADGSMTEQDAIRGFVGAACRNFSAVQAINSIEDTHGNAVGCK